MEWRNWTNTNFRMGQSFNVEWNIEQTKWRNATDTECGMGMDAEFRMGALIGMEHWSGLSADCCTMTSPALTKNGVPSLAIRNAHCFYDDVLHYTNSPTLSQTVCSVCKPSHMEVIHWQDTPYLLTTAVPQTQQLCQVSCYADNEQQE